MGASVTGCVLSKTGKLVGLNNMVGLAIFLYASHERVTKLSGSLKRVL